jgi:hypothetical protein
VCEVTNPVRFSYEPAELVSRIRSAAHGCNRKTHKRVLLLVGCRPIQLGFRVLDKPTSEMVDACTFGVNLNVETLFAMEPARITYDFGASAIGCAR